MCVSSASLQGNRDGRGTDTSITIIDPSGSMKASIVHPNVLITIGTLSYRFMDTHRLVEGQLSPQGAIRVESAGREIYDDQRSRERECDQHSGSDGRWVGRCCQLRRMSEVSEVRILIRGLQ